MVCSSLLQSSLPWYAQPGGYCGRALPLHLLDASLQSCRYVQEEENVFPCIFTNIFVEFFVCELDLLLKGEVSRDFLSFFLFHESKLSGPRICRLKWFYLEIRFREDIREKFDSAQC